MKRKIKPAIKRSPKKLAMKRRKKNSNEKKKKSDEMKQILW